MTWTLLASHGKVEVYSYSEEQDTYRVIYKDKSDYLVKHGSVKESFDYLFGKGAWDKVVIYSDKFDMIKNTNMFTVEFTYPVTAYYGKDT